MDVAACGCFPGQGTLSEQADALACWPIGLALILWLACKPTCRHMGGNRLDTGCTVVMVAAAVLSWVPAKAMWVMADVEGRVR